VSANRMLREAATDASSQRQYKSESLGVHSMFPRFILEKEN
jgi:hypothetical protein